MSNRHFQRRVQFVDMEPMDDSSENSNQTWLQDGLNSMQLKRSEMNELIMDYLVHEGFKEAAERFKDEAGIGPVSFLKFSPPASSSSASSSSNNNIESSNIAVTLPQAEGTTTTDIDIQNKAKSPNNSNQNNHNSNIITNNKNNRDQHQSSQNYSPLSPNSHHQQPNNNNNGNNNNINNQQQNGDNNNLTTSMNGDGWISKFENPEMMDKRIEVRHFIEEGDILKAQMLINLYYPELLDSHRNMYFKLQQQHLIELIRQQKINDVLAYVHDQLSVDELRDLTEMERTLALLAYEQPDKSPYAGLLEISHRLKLASEINDIILQETTGNVEATKPRLVTLLKLLFWTQSELERKKIQFPKMTDLVNGTIVEPRH